MNSSPARIRSGRTRRKGGPTLAGIFDARDQTQLPSAQLTANDLRAATLVWRRDFQNGIGPVILSGSAKTVDLGGIYRKIQGVFDPKFNDGSSVAQINLSPKSRVVLLNMP